MQLSRQAQVHLSTVCAVLAIAFYFLAYLRSHSQNPIKDSHGHLNKALGNRQRQLTQILHPEEHVHRAPKKIYLHFNITLGHRYPDGVKKQVFLINGQFPGPTIEARSADELQIDVTNSVDNDEGIALHWHGLSMRGANEMDGTVGLTQCALGKFESFSYKFKIEDNQAGTFWYHAHSEVHRADGLYGALIVHKPATSGDSDMIVYGYDEELLLLIGDWYHRPASAILAYYMDWNNYGVEPAPDSLLINGIGAFNCSMAVPARPLQCKHLSAPYLDINGRRARLRVVNTGALTGFTLSITGYDMNVFQVDGGNSVNSELAAESIGILYPGERMDVLVEQTGNLRKGDSKLTIALDPENMKFPNLALTRIQDFPVVSSRRHGARTRQVSQKEQSSTRYWNLTTISGLTPMNDTIPTTVSKVFLLYTKIEILAEFHNIPKGFVNRTSWEPYAAKSPPLLALDRSAWDKKRYVPWAEAGADTWIDIVVNNMDDKGHPFHLHGNDFFLLATHKAPFGSYEAYNPFDTSKPPAGGPLNTRNPPKKDTVFVPRMGYVVLRLRASNEGLWFFHCHVLWHEAVGMAMAFQIGGDAVTGWAGAREGAKAGELCRNP